MFLFMLKVILSKATSTVPVALDGLQVQDIIGDSFCVSLALGTLGHLELK